MSARRCSQPAQPPQMFERPMSPSQTLVAPQRAPPCSSLPVFVSPPVAPPLAAHHKWRARTRACAVVRVLLSRVCLRSPCVAAALTMYIRCHCLNLFASHELAPRHCFHGPFHRPKAMRHERHTPPTPCKNGWAVPWWSGCCKRGEAGAVNARSEQQVAGRSTGRCAARPRRLRRFSPPPPVAGHFQTPPHTPWGPQQHTPAPRSQPPAPRPCRPRGRGCSTPSIPSRSTSSPEAPTDAAGPRGAQPAVQRSQHATACPSQLLADQ